MVLPFSGKDLKQLHMDKMSEFDPIRQHRHFCPWIASTGDRAPGWEQTLSALLCRKDFCSCSPAYSPSSASMIKVSLNFTYSGNGGVTIIFSAENGKYN